MEKLPRPPFFICKESHLTRHATLVQVRAAAEKAGRARLAERVLKDTRKALRVSQSFDAFLNSDLPPVRRFTPNLKRGV